MPERARGPRVKRPGGVRRAHVLRIELRDIAPPIWRDLLLPSDATLATLHAAIQAAFGWEDCHLHAFRAGRATLTHTRHDPEAGRAEERRFTVADVLPRVGSQLLYEYDFGDGWEHTVSVLEVRALEADAPCALQCLGGARACPPEDCGGAGGYADMLLAIAHPNHARHDEILEWLGEDFDSEAFDLEAADRAVRGLARKGRRRG